MKVKADVEFHPNLYMLKMTLLVEEILEYVTNPATPELVITSSNDGQHRTDSKHYIGDALDFRTRNLTFEEQQTWAWICQYELGPNWDVVLEKTHLHIEFDPE